MKKVEVYFIEELKGKQRELAIYEIKDKTGFYNIIDDEINELTTSWIEDYNLFEDIEIHCTSDYRVQHIDFTCTISHESVMKIINKLEGLEEFKSEILERVKGLDITLSMERVTTSMKYEFDLKFTHIPNDLFEELYMNTGFLDSVVNIIDSRIEEINKELKPKINSLLDELYSEDYIIDYARNHEYIFLSNGHIVFDYYMDTCPLCKEEKTLNALSRTSDEKICSDCSVEQAMRDYEMNKAI